MHKAACDRFTETQAVCLAKFEHLANGFRPDFMLLRCRPGARRKRSLLHQREELVFQFHAAGVGLGLETGFHFRLEMKSNGHVEPHGISILRQALCAFAERRWEAWRKTSALRTNSTTASLM